MSDEIEVIVNGEKLLMNQFVSSMIRDVILAMLNNLRDVEISTITKVEIS